jgi:hypothetical protein
VRPLTPLLLVLCAALSATPSLAADAPHVVTCELRASSGGYGGGCDMLGEHVTMSVSPAAALLGGPWRSDTPTTSIWIGTMTVDGDSAPVELEVDADRRAVLRTVFAWFPVEQLDEGPDRLALTVNTDEELAPSTIDAKIIERAGTILSSAEVWNRADTRDCPETETTYSLYCAIDRATAEVTGKLSPLEHRRPAMEVIREIVDDRTKGRPYHHRLMDYNNDPATTFPEIQSILNEGLRNVSDAAWLQAHGFAVPPPLPSVAAAL